MSTPFLLPHIGPTPHFAKVQLDLSMTPVTDAGLEHVKSLTSLEVLNVRKTAVTAQGVKDLQGILPQCEIRLVSPGEGHSRTPG